MCHPGIPSIRYSDHESNREGRRVFMLQVRMVVAAINSNGNGTGGGGGGSVINRQQCLCSPTKHPRSFRCRYHQSEYEWGSTSAARKLPKLSSSSSGSR